MLNEELINGTLKDHECKLRTHDDEIGTLKMKDAVKDVQIANLCKSIGQLTSAMYWFVGTIIAGFIGMMYTIAQK